MERLDAAELILSACPALTRAVARRAEGIVHVYHGLERELRILTDEITLRTAIRVPVTADDLERWLMRSQNINQRQHRANDELNALASDLNETATSEGIGVFLQGLFQPGIESFGAAANDFTAAVTTAAAALRD